MATALAAFRVPDVLAPAAFRAEQALAVRGRTPKDLPGGGDAALREAALATLLMDEFRTSGDDEVFEILVDLVRPQMLARVRQKLRHLGHGFDCQEVLQDALINIYRYPAKFDASRPGAFAAWSTTIIDNAVRRQLRQRRTGVPLAFDPSESFEQRICSGAQSPDEEASDHEEGERTASAFAIVLQCYAAAFATLSQVEQRVLTAVEVDGRRYADIGAETGKRAEAIKMVVFRARRRIHERIAAWLGGSLGVATLAVA